MTIFANFLKKAYLKTNCATVAVKWKRAVNNEKENVFSMEEKLDNEFLLKKQIETLKIFLEKGVISKETYDFEIETLTKKIKIDKD